MTADINRWHCHPDPLLRNSGDTVRLHSDRVVSLCHSLAARIGHPLVDSELLYSARHHDAAEAVLGDIPGPAKRRFPALAAAYAKAELEVLTEMGLTWSLTRLEADMLDLCDKLDAVRWAKRCGVWGDDWDDEVTRLRKMADRIGAAEWLEEMLATPL